MKAYKIEDQIRHNIKKELCKHIVIIPENKYRIEIDQKEWHKIFQTEKLNKTGITFDK